MKGFKDFVMRGNLVEIAVAFIIATAFATVVTAFTAVILALVGKIFGNPNFDSFQPGDIPVGAFITALVAFVILALIVYFFVVKPYESAKERYASPVEEEVAEEIELLREIRDSLRARGGSL